MISEHSAAQAAAHPELGTLVGQASAAAATNPSWVPELGRRGKQQQTIVLSLRTQTITRNGTLIVGLSGEHQSTSDSRRVNAL